MFAAFVVSIVISVALAVDQTVGQALANNRNSKITEEANKIYDQISKDRSLVNQLYDAYTKRDAALASQMLISSPFGNRIQVLKRAFRKNQNDLSTTSTQLNDIDVKNQEITSKVQNKQSQSQTSGSAIGDLISGAAKDPTTNPLTYAGSGVTEQTIKEVNYGQKK